MRKIWFDILSIGRFLRGILSGIHAHQGSSSVNRSRANRPDMRFLVCLRHLCITYAPIAVRKVFVCHSAIAMLRVGICLCSAEAFVYVIARFSAPVSLFLRLCSISSSIAAANIRKIAFASPKTIHSRVAILASGRNLRIMVSLNMLTVLLDPLAVGKTLCFLRSAAYSVKPRTVRYIACAMSSDSLYHFTANSHSISIMQTP